MDNQPITPEPDLNSPKRPNKILVIVGVGIVVFVIIVIIIVSLVAKKKTSTQTGENTSPSSQSKTIPTPDQMYYINAALGNGTIISHKMQGNSVYALASGIYRELINNKTILISRGKAVLTFTPDANTAFISLNQSGTKLIANKFSFSDINVGDSIEVTLIINKDGSMMINSIRKLTPLPAKKINSVTPTIINPK